MPRMKPFFRPSGRISFLTDLKKSGSLARSNLRACLPMQKSNKQSISFPTFALRFGFPVRGDDRHIGLYQISP